MTKHSLIFAFVLSLICLPGAPAQNSNGKFINFSIPGALTAPVAGFYQLPGTIVQDLNDSGQLIGYYTTESSASTRGFFRSSNGKFTLIDDPGAGTPVSGGPLTDAGTVPYAINNLGSIVGSFSTSVPVTEAFSLTLKGNFTNFFAPPNSYFTQAFAINSTGTITGRTGIFDQNTFLGLTYGLIMTPDGKTITFQSPSAFISGWGLNGTTSVAINRSGATAGYYYDASSIAHTYIRGTDGTFVEFEVPGAGTASYTGAWPIEIDDAGNVVGFYYDNNFSSHGYVRLANGTFTTISPPPGINSEMFVDWMNQKGDVAGTYTDANGTYHAFVRMKNGHFSLFSDPQAGTGAGQGTFPIRINNQGQVAGYYVDVNNVYHGYLWTLGD